MSDNPGAKDHHEMALSTTELGQTGGSRDGMIPEVAGYTNPGPTKNLRGVESNTDESKGSPAPHPLAASIDHHGMDAPPGPVELEECT